MTLTKDHGGPAFPVPQGGRGGMTLRDYFAGQVLAGLGDAIGQVDVAKVAYLVADAMIEARK